MDYNSTNLLSVSFTCFVGTLSVISILSVVLCWCCCGTSSNDDDDDSIDVEEGSHDFEYPPKVLYLQSDLSWSSCSAPRTSTLCAICLEDYTDGDLWRNLTTCGHSFHAACIDVWFKEQSTCPVCRCSPALP